MLRPATEILREHIGEAVLSVTMLAIALVAVGAAVFAASSLDRISRVWISEYRPVVYLAPGAGSTEANALSEQVGSWGEVERAEVRTPGDAYRTASSRIGEESLTRVGVEPEVFPYSLVVRPAGGHGDVELVAQLEALETRENVDSVDVPSESVRESLDAARWIVLGGLVPFGILLVGAFGQLGSLLRRLRRSERRELLLAERFGAGRMELARALLLRGGVLGLWAGLFASGIFLVIALSWRTMETSMFGGALAATPGIWWVVAVPLLLGPLGGAGIGLWVALAGFDGGDRTTTLLDSLLEYD